MKPRTILLLIATLLAPSSVSANSSILPTKVNGLTMHDFGNEIFITASSEITNGEGCAKNNQLALQKTHPLFKEMYSALLAAYHGNTKIAGWVHGCHAFGMPNLTRLDLVK